MKHGGPGWEGKRFMTFLSHIRLWALASLELDNFKDHPFMMITCWHTGLNMGCHSFSYFFKRDGEEKNLHCSSVCSLVHKCMVPWKLDKNSNVTFFIKPFLFFLLGVFCISLLSRNYFCTSKILLFRLITIYLSYSFLL